MNAILPHLALLLEDPPTTEKGSGPSFLIPMLLVFGIFYFVMILPQSRQRKKREAMLNGMKKGDEVMTSSGIYGRIAMIQDDVVTLQVADGVRLRFNRAAIQDVLGADAADKGKGAD